MASISKRVSGAWQNTSYGIRATATDTITSLPTIIYADGTNAAVSIKGNTVQSGTPTPENPIIPQGTGERTGNLWDEETLVGYYNSSGSYTYATGQLCTKNKIPVTPNTQYWLGVPATDPAAFLSVSTYNSQGAFVERFVLSSYSGAGVSYTTNANTYYINVNFSTYYGGTYKNNVMICEGSNVMPYEPYGYKTPISSAGQTTPVYLGDVHTTRRVKKLVLDGTETITEESTNVYSIPINDTVTAEAGLSTHFEYDSTVLAGQFRIEAGKAVFGYNDTLANFSTFLAAQYAAGTPVTVWYVLATEETAVVNEPLMKIDGYADKVNNISIPTTDGANTLSVDTTVQPSEVDINYHGWHMGTVHERTSGQWD